ncbi:MAG: endolytic transglycosylase MltG [Bacteroidota bacterium]
MRLQSKEIFFGGILLVSLVLIMVLFYGYQVLYTPNFQVEKKDTIIFIKPQENFKDLLKNLKKEKIVQDPISFAFISQLMDYQDNVKEGRYRIQKNMNNLQAVRMLRAGDQKAVRVTFNNIRKLDKFAEKAASYLSFDADALLHILEDSSQIKTFGFDQENIISLFLPNTYEVYWTTTPQEFVEKMYQEYQKFWNEARLAKAKALDLSPQEVSTLASIVQAETNKEDEKARIAGLYLNRIFNGMRLEADPTLVFALDDFSIKRVLNRHKKVDSPYNTYMHKGLPPGPINMPSPSSIDAVLSYEQHEYFFMCAREDLSGYHNFARTNEEHEKNARLLHAALDARGIY